MNIHVSFLLGVVAHVGIVVFASATEYERSWPNTAIGRSMHDLQTLQNSHQTGELDWERKMRELILVGPDAVPELIAALDAAPRKDRMMLRSIPFILRGIGDKRAIPALIRAIPRCFGMDGSDMGYDCEDPDLLKFLQEHDNNDRKDRGYSYGRPVTEVFRTLEQWTGIDNGSMELAFVSKDEGTPRQRQLKIQLFQDNAHRWEVWWKEHWHEHIDDADFAEVNLPPPEEFGPVDYQLIRSQPLGRTGTTSNLIIQPFLEAKAERIFYDLDTSRWSGLPRRFRDYSRDQLLDSKAELTKWAATEGFDLIGSEFADKDRRSYTIEPLDLEAWEVLPAELWSREHRSSQYFENAGRLTDKLLVHYDSELDKYDCAQTAAFFYITNEGTPGLLYLGVDVTDTNIRPGRATEDQELNHMGLFKGRRFGLIRLQ